VRLDPHLTDFEINKQAIRGQLHDTVRLLGLLPNRATSLSHKSFRLAAVLKTWLEFLKLVLSPSSQAISLSRKLSIKSTAHVANDIEAHVGPGGDQLNQLLAETVRGLSARSLVLAKELGHGSIWANYQERASKITQLLGFKCKKQTVDSSSFVLGVSAIFSDLQSASKTELSLQLRNPS
jgi:hypothetical protein